MLWLQKFNFIFIFVYYIITYLNNLIKSKRGYMYSPVSGWQAQLDMNPGFVTPSAPPPDDESDDVSYPKIVPYDAKKAKELQDCAQQAYFNVYKEIVDVANLRSLDHFDASSIQTLKQIEEKSKQGIVINLLQLMIKVLQVVGKLSLGIAVGTSLALILSPFFGVPGAAVAVSALLATPILGALVAMRIVCKVMIYGVGKLKQRQMESSFASAIQIEKDRVLALKGWVHLKNLLQTEQHFRMTIDIIMQAQQFVGYDQQRQDQIVCLQGMVNKIAQFRDIAYGQLDINNSMPLLNQFLNR